MQTFVGAEEVEELNVLRDQNRALLKLIAEQKREIKRISAQPAMRLG